MALSLREEQAIADMADILSDFLPGSGSSAWKGHVNFKTVVEEVGVARFWPGGSKVPAVVTLLRQTLRHERRCFERLVLTIVRTGMTYRQKQRRPITSPEIERLNGALLGVGFKFPDLWDPDLHTALRMDGDSRASAQIETALQEERLRSTALSKRSQRLDELKHQFFELHSDQDRQAAGLALETLLSELFALEGLSP